MAPFLSTVALLLGVAAAASVQSDGKSVKQSSVKQIRDTLKNLLRSIEDNGRDAEALFGKRQLWCDNTIQAVEADNQVSSASLLDMQAQLTETEAEVEEAEGTVQQVKVDIEMVQHTIQQTADMLKERTEKKGDASVLSALVENKQLSLKSLQGELEVAVPVLAQLQANVAESKQRISYRTETAATTTDYISALKESCQGSSNSADAQGAARVSESNSLHVALQELDEASKAASNDDDAQASQALSFVQVADRNQEVTTDDLSDLFASDQDAHRGNSVEVAAVPRRVARSAPAPLRPRIAALISQLRSDGSSASDQTAWCAKQREDSAMALKFAQDSVAQISSELEAHTAAEAELGEDLTHLQASAATVTAAAKNVLKQASKEQALIQSSLKDQQLATKIIDQATTILREMGMTNSTKKVVKALDTTKSMLVAQIKADAHFDREASSKAKAVAEKALDLTKDQESEQHNLEFARDDHASVRLRDVENKRLYLADVEEATDYVKKLGESCSADGIINAKKQRDAQVHALEDADKALDGKLIVEATNPQSSLRGPKPSDKNLTPMQRAAMEMGVAMD